MRKFISILKLFLIIIICIPTASIMHVSLDINWKKFAEHTVCMLNNIMGTRQTKKKCRCLRCSLLSYDKGLSAPRKNGSLGERRVFAEDRVPVPQRLQLTITLLDYRIVALNPSNSANWLDTPTLPPAWCSRSRLFASRRFTRIPNYRVARKASRLDRREFAQPGARRIFISTTSGRLAGAHGQLW